MNTISVISSISYNTPEFFELKIKELTSGKSRILDWAHWVIHQPEEDETKAHIHFVVKPSRRIDTNALRDCFKEPITEAHLAGKLQRGEQITPNDLKPLGCLPFDKTTSMSDWLLYAVHDIKYLFKKGQSRKIHYDKSAVQSTEPEYLHQQWEDCKDPLSAFCDRVLELRAQEYTFGQILATGMIPPNLVYYMKNVFEDSPDSTYRGKRKGHEIMNDRKLRKL